MNLVKKLTVHLHSDSLRYVRFDWIRCAAFIASLVFQSGLQDLQASVGYPTMEFLDMNFNKGLESFTPCFSQSLLLADFLENYTRKNPYKNPGN